MKILSKIGSFLFTIYAFAAFLIIMLIVFPFILVASLFGKIRGGNYIYDICRIWADIWLLMIGIRHSNIYETNYDDTKPYIFLSNHISYMDIPMILKAIRNKHIRVLGKAELSKVPIFGFIYRSAAVLVDRNSASDRAKSVKTLQSVLRKNISVFICPEGTFNMTHHPLKFFFDGAFRIAIETQTPIMPIIFPDTYDRLHYESIFSLNPGKCRAVFLEEIPTTGLTSQDLEALKLKVYAAMENAIIRYKASWIKSV